MSKEIDDLREVWQFVAQTSANFYREDPKFGRCSRCRQPANDLIDFAGLLWAVCDVCRLKWYTGLGVESENDRARQEMNLETLLRFECVPREYDPHGWPKSIVSTIADEPSIIGAGKDEAMNEQSTMSPAETEEIELAKLAKRLGIPHDSPLHNLQLLLHAREKERINASTPAPPRESTALEREMWAQTLASEDRQARDRRDSLVEFYKRHEFYEFTVQLESPFIPRNGEVLSGRQAMEFLTLGAPYIAFFRAQGTGEYSKRLAGR